MFLPVHELLWRDVKEFENYKRLKAKLETDELLEKIKLLEQERDWIAKALIERTQVRPTSTRSYSPFIGL